MAVRLSLFALPDVPRSDAGTRHIRRFYSGIESLWDSDLDGLIVTGAEPHAESLTDEPYWESLAKVIEWAERNTRSTIWSCLAAHAAILHIDGIGRRRLPDKRSGLFECTRVSEHPLMAGVATSLRMPHSRWNDISEDELVDRGYSVLTRMKDGGVDIFAKQRQSLFVFFQGHPEYETNTLLLEYRRDIGRYLRRERDLYPLMPEGYFDDETADAFTSLRRRAISGRNNDLLEDFPAARAEKGIANTWFQPAAKVYENWLEFLCERKERRSKRIDSAASQNPSLAASRRE
jgi:homoserine O-succinyltransferase